MTLPFTQANQEKKPTNYFGSLNHFLFNKPEADAVSFSHSVAPVSVPQKPVGGKKAYKDDYIKVEIDVFAIT